MTHVPPALLHDHLPLMSTSSLPFLYFHTPFSVRIRFSLKLNALKESSSFLLEAQQGFFNRLVPSGTTFLVHVSVAREMGKSKREDY
jgi:hypothetical protein